MRREVFFLDNATDHAHYRAERVNELLLELRRTWNENEQVTLKVDLYKEHIFWTVAGYSLGDELEDLKIRFKEGLKYYHQYCIGGGQKLDLRKLENYHLTLWTVSMAMLFGLEAEEMDELLNNLGVGGKDALLDSLIAVVQPDLESVKELIHPTAFSYLLKAANTPSGADGQIHLYLSAYYDSLKGLGWYDSHLTSKPRFFGYWSFEAAAVVKAFNISDGAFADNIFYPRDMVHQRMFRTWLDDEEGGKDRREMKTAIHDEEVDAAAEFLGQYFKKQLGAEGDGIPDALNVLSKLSNVPQEEVQENPDLMQSIMVQVMRSVLGASGDLQKILDGQESKEMKDFVKAIKEQEADWEGIEIDAEAMLEFLPPEVVEAMEEKEGKVAIDFLNEQYGQLSGRLSDVLDKEKVDQLTFLEGVEKLIGDFGHLLGSDPRPVIRNNVADKVANELREKRKGKNLSNFDWSSLFENKPE